MKRYPHSFSLSRNEKETLLSVYIIAFPYYLANEKIAHLGRKSYFSSVCGYNVYSVSILIYFQAHFNDNMVSYQIFTAKHGCKGYDAS